MSEKKKLEKLFHEGLGKMGAHPPKGTKISIEKKLAEAGFLKDDSSSRRMFFWIMGVIGLILLTVTSGYFILNENKDPAQEVVVNNQNAAEVKAEKKAGNESGVQRENYQPAKLPSGDIQSETNAGLKEKEDSSANKSNFEISNQNLQNDNAEKTRTNFPGQFNNSNNISNSNGIALSEKSANGTVTTATRTSTTVPDEDNSEVGKKTSPESVDRNILSDSTHSSKKDSAITVDSLTTKDIPEIILPDDSITTQNADSSKTREEKNNLSEDKKKVEETNKKKLIIDFTAGPQWSSAKYKSTDARYPIFADDAKNSETEKMGFSAGVMAQIPLKKFLIQTGINYSLLKSSFYRPEIFQSIDTSRSLYEYRDTTEMDTIGPDTIYTTYHIDSTWVTINDTTPGKNALNKSNQISTIEVPLWIGYKFTRGKFDFEIKSGLSVAFITGINTAIHSVEPDSLMYFKSRKNSPYRSYFLNFLAGATLAYNINEKFSLMLQPVYKMGLNSIFKNDHMIEKKIQSYSLVAGLRVKF